MPPGLRVDRLLGIPADVLAGLRMLPVIAEHTGAMQRHTARLEEMTGALQCVSSDTEALPALRAEMSQVAEATAVLGPMDERMATIAESMPILVEVQQHLSRLPETIGRLDERIEQLSTLLERMLASLDQMSRSVETLHEGVGPLSRLARRLPGQG